MDFKDWGTTVTDEFTKVLEKLQEGELLTTKDKKSLRKFLEIFLNQIECLHKVFHTLYREGLLDTKDDEGCIMAPKITPIL